MLFAVATYIGVVTVQGVEERGAYFLALKLQSGKAVGDIQPLVVEYESDKPMIPIELTGVAADPDPLGSREEGR